MDTPHYIAIETYGSQRVTFAGQTVSAYKIGYSTVGKAALLQLYGSAARDVTSKHASYHYVQITGATCSHQGYLVLALSETEFAQVQQITRPHPTRRSGIWYWQHQWRHFPYAETAEFTLPLGRGGPTFDPTRLRVVSPSQNTSVEVPESIHAEYVQRSPDEAGWWWLSGATYPHRELLKLQGLRWSAKRQQWYFIGKTLPPAVQALLTATAVPASLTSAILAIFGGQLAGKEYTADGEIIVMGRNQVFATRQTVEQSAHQSQPIWSFDLPPLERVGHPLPAIRAALNQAGAVNTIYDQRWRLEKAEQVAALDALAERTPFTNTPPKPTSAPTISADDAPCSDEEAERILGVKLTPKPATPKPPEHHFALGQTVYLATSLRVERDKKLRMDTQGKVIRRYAFKKTPDYRHQLAYGVDFGEHGTITLFQDSLADTPYNIPGIERHEVIPIMFGVSAEQGIMGEVERRQRIPQNYTVLDELPTELRQAASHPQYMVGQRVFIQTGRGLPVETVTIRQVYPPCLNAHQKPEIGYRVQGGVGEYTVFESELTADPPKPIVEVQMLESPGERRRTEAYWEQVRVARAQIGQAELPAPIPEPPSSAGLPLPEPPTAELPAPPEPTPTTPSTELANPLPTLTTPKKPKIEPQYHPTPRFTPTQTYTLPQTYIGQIGSAVGTVFAFGAATWEHQPVYVDIAGGNAAVQSVWARLADGQSVHIVPLETGGANILLQPRAKGSLKPLRKKLALGLDHLLLLHHDLVEPIYGETSATYLIELDAMQRVAKLAAHITHLVQIAVFENYHRYLWEAGQTAKLLRRCSCYGSLPLWHLQLDQSAWTTLICDGLQSGQLELPKGTP